MHKYRMVIERKVGDDRSMVQYNDDLAALIETGEDIVWLIEGVSPDLVIDSTYHGQQIKVTIEAQD